MSVKVNDCTSDLPVVAPPTENWYPVILDVDLTPSLPCEMVTYVRMHVEYNSTSGKNNELIKRLKATGVVIVRDNFVINKSIGQERSSIIGMCYYCLLFYWMQIIRSYQCCTYRHHGVAMYIDSG